MKTSPLTPARNQHRFLAITFASSKAAIDLASIMVGVIVIGLLGGVIGATLFAVIPWVQDSLAKQQLDNIYEAQSAYGGFTAAVGQPIYGTLNANSLNAPEANGGGSLMTANPEKYCSIARDGGADFVSYSQSASGKVFYASKTAGEKNKQELAAGAELPCTKEGEVGGIGAWDCSKSIQGYGFYDDKMVNCAWAQGAVWNDTISNPTDPTVESCTDLLNNYPSSREPSWEGDIAMEKQGWLDACVSNGWKLHRTDLMASTELGFNGVYLSAPSAPSEPTDDVPADDPNAAFIQQFNVTVTAEATPSSGIPIEAHLICSTWGNDIYNSCESTFPETHDYANQVERDAIVSIMMKETDVANASESIFMNCDFGDVSCHENAMTIALEGSFPEHGEGFTTQVASIKYTTYARA